MQGRRRSEKTHRTKLDPDDLAAHKLTRAGKAVSTNPVTVCEEGKHFREAPWC